MTRSLGKKTSAAIIAAAVSASAVPVLAQSLGSYAQYCSQIAGRLVCNLGYGVEQHPALRALG